MIRACLTLLLVLAVAWAVPDAAQAKRDGARSSASTGKAKKAVKAVAKAKPEAKPRKASQRVARRAVPARPSEGQLAGLRATDDPLDLRSSVALVVDQSTNEVLLAKNEQAVLPIASITKLMAALVVTEARLSLEEPLIVSADDVAVYPGRHSKLRAGTTLTRGELLHLTLMSSENRAAHALGRTFPGGMGSFVGRMNDKARELGMLDTRYVEPTGLSSDNRSTAQDLVRLVKAAVQHPLLRELSTTVDAVMPVGRRHVQFQTTNGLVRNPDWEIGLQKTGYIAAAGRCVVMQAQFAGRQLIMVLLDSAGRYSRIGDAERIRHWLGAKPEAARPTVAPTPAAPAAVGGAPWTAPAAWARATEVLDLDAAAATALHPTTR